MYIVFLCSPFSCMGFHYIFKNQKKQSCKKKTLWIKDLAEAPVRQRVIGSNGTEDSVKKIQDTGPSCKENFITQRVFSMSVANRLCHAVPI